jgi:hypothetical protein
VNAAHVNGADFTLSDEYHPPLAAGIKQVPPGRAFFLQTTTQRAIVDRAGGYMRIYKIMGFTRFQRRERIGDASLTEAVSNADRGLIDADLGGGLIKQRVARPGQGKSGGFRTLIAYRRGDRAVFLFGFAKNERANIDDDELETWREVGRAYLGLDAKGVEAAIAVNELTEIDHDETD